MIARTRFARARLALDVRQAEGVVDEYTLAARRYMGKEWGDAYIASLPPDISMGRIAVHPEHVAILDFQTELPSPVSKLRSRS